MGMSNTCRRFDLRTCGLSLTEADVLLNRTEKQRGALRYPCKLLAQLHRVELLQGLPIDENAPLLWVIETQQQVEYR
ncbi:hypothetical protein D3C76_1243340 [compost metagenome]